MSRKYKKSAKLRNKTAVQRYRTRLNNSAYTPWEVLVTPPKVTRCASLWKRLTGWFKL